MQKIVVHTAQTISTTVRAPELARVADALAGTDRHAKIRRVLLEKQGALACPACGHGFSVESFRVTKTSYHESRALVCRGCATAFVVDERHVA